MRISAKAEYACIAMVELARSHSEPQPIRIKAIADHHGIPQRFLVQILLQLKGVGLVASTRGAAGGYQLARLPEQISLADIINTIDRTPAPRSTSVGATQSPVVRALQSVWKEIQVQEQQMLESLSLADLVRRTQPGGLTYEI